MRAPTPLEPIDQPRLLLVEGADDDRFFTALLRSNDRRGVQIMSFHGFGRLPTFLATLPASDGFPQLQWLGFIVDADGSASRRFEEVARWIAVQSRRRRPLRFPVPRRAWQVAADGQGRSTAVFVLPPGEASGDLETWLLSSVGTREETACAEAFADCLGAAAPRPRSKLVMAAYLAANDPEKLKIGDAIQTAGVIPLIHEFYRPLLDLIPPDDETIQCPVCTRGERARVGSWRHPRRQLSLPERRERRRVRHRHDRGRGRLPL